MHYGCGFLCFFFNDTATTEIYTLSLHDALPISEEPGFLTLDDDPSMLDPSMERPVGEAWWEGRWPHAGINSLAEDRKSTRLNSSHANISYAVFCLKKKKNPHIARAHLSTPDMPK